MNRHTRRGTTLGALIATAGLLTLTGAALATAAPIVTDQDLECVYLTGDQILVDDPNTFEPIVGVSTDVSVTLDYASPADPGSALDVALAFGPGIINATDIRLDELSLASYAVTATTADGIVVGAGFVDDDLVFPADTPAVAPGEPLPALPPGELEVEVGPLAAGRTVYLQPVALFLNGDPDVAEPPSNLVIGSCSPLTDDDALTSTLDFPVTFTGDALPLPQPGQQEVVLDTDEPVSPGDEIDVDVSGFLPGALVFLQECPLASDPCPDLDDIGFGEIDNGGIPVAGLGSVRANPNISAIGRAAAAGSAVTKAVDNLLGPGVVFVEDDGTGQGSVVIGNADDTGCGVADPCELVAQDIERPGYVGRALITYAGASEPTPTATSTPTQSVNESGSTLPETGAATSPIGAVGGALLVIGVTMVAHSRARAKRQH